MTQILTLAQEHSLAGKMSSSQAYYVQGWVVGAIAIAYLKIREAGIATPQQTETIASGCKASENRRKVITTRTRERATETARTITSTGQELNSQRLVWRRTIAKTSIGRWRLMTTESIRYSPMGASTGDGRGGRALHYHLYALAPLVLLAEFGEANHLDLYAHANGAIHRLVNFSVAGLQDPRPFVKATGVQQEVPKTINGDQIGWAPPYVQRFPNPALEQ